jgi:putative inorganic carbon (hco3(-)) transporter
VQDLFTPRDNSLWGKMKILAGQQLVSQKLNSPLGLALLLLATLPLSYLLATLDLKLSIVLFIGLIGIPLVIFCLFNIAFAIGLMLFVSLAIPIALKYTDAPIGTLLDLLILLSTVGILLRQIKERDWGFAKSPLSYMILLWLYFNVMQVLNPEAQSKLAWVYTVRSVAIQQVVFFIGAYAFKNSRAGLVAVLKLIIALCFASALYGLKQQFLGFSTQEKIWMMADQERYQLYYQWGMIRIPSFCYDPTTFGILMVCFAVFCAALVVGDTKRPHKILLGIMGLTALWATA